MDKIELCVFDTITLKRLLKVIENTFASDDNIIAISEERLIEELRKTI